MTIAEPSTLLTDYILAGVTGWLGWLLFRARDGERSRSWWALAFAALALASALGGTWHGFADALAAVAALLLWKATLLSVGVTSFGMVAGSVTATTAGAAKGTLLGIAAVKLVIYSGWMLGHSEFIYVIADTGIALGLVAALHLPAAARDRASRWILAGVGVSVLASTVQASGFAPHRRFTHNDLFHVIQVAATILFYAGTRELRDRRRGFRIRDPWIEAEP